LKRWVDRVLTVASTTKADGTELGGKDGRFMRGPTRRRLQPDRDTGGLHALSCGRQLLEETFRAADADATAVCVGDVDHDTSLARAAPLIRQWFDEVSGARRLPDPIETKFELRRRWHRHR
jgi:hypothetical protein